jgi:hypothetical protein
MSLYESKRCSGRIGQQKPLLLHSDLPKASRPLLCGSLKQQA